MTEDVKKHLDTIEKANIDHPNHSTIKSALDMLRKLLHAHYDIESAKMFSETKTATPPKAAEANVLIPAVGQPDSSGKVSKGTIIPISVEDKLEMKDEVK